MIPSADSNRSPSQRPTADRRTFLKGSSLLLAGGAVAGGLNIARAAHSYGSDVIKIGLVGCGGRGTQAAIQAMNTRGGEVRIVALADVFENQVQTAFRGIKSQHPDKFDVTEETRFIGLDGYKGVIASDCDLVILATPPGFRPLHFEAAVNADKHVFMEKPVATDAPGVRRVLAANEVAKKKGLAVAVGLQRHHEDRYRETVGRLHDGAIGQPIMARAYWNGGGVWTRPRQANQSELEYQVRNWYYFNWLCGDHIVEQHIHNLDVINWVMQDYPTEAQGQGGRQVRTGSDSGEIFDHHFVEYTYDGGTKMMSQCRHIPGCWNSVSEHVHGTEGYCDVSAARIYDLKGNVVWQSDAKNHDGGGWQQEHHNLFAALRRGERPNEGDNGAMSTLTSIMGRLATYGGKPVKLKEALESDIALADFDSLTDLDQPAPLQPDSDGRYPIAVPGKTRVV
jgi:myo-inositol 2-dehydrogenase / D-chiro-inositol 1-dehydrogenase